MEQSGNDINSIREVMCKLPLMIISPDGKTFEMKVEIDINDITRNSFKVLYRHSITKEILFEHQFLLDADPSYGIEYFEMLLSNNQFRVLKRESNLSLEEGKE